MRLACSPHVHVAGSASRSTRTQGVDEQSALCARDNVVQSVRICGSATRSNSARQAACGPCAASVQYGGRGTIRIATRTHATTLNLVRAHQSFNISNHSIVHAGTRP
jgi:hypothetical protein